MTQLLVLDIPMFRKEFTEFNDSTVYPTAMITFWGTFAELELRKHIWKCAWPTAVKLFVAHEITIAAQNAKLAANGGVPGTSGGITNSKTVGGASVGYDSAATSEKDAGFYNRTTYGQQFYRLAMMYGAGALQLNGVRAFRGNINIYG